MSENSQEHMIETAIVRISELNEEVSGLKAIDELRVVSLKKCIAENKALKEELKELEHILSREKQPK